MSRIDDLETGLHAPYEAGEKHNVSTSGSNELLCENKTQRIQIDNLERLLAFEKREKMMIRVSMLSPMTLGEWKELKQQEPGLFNFIKGAVNGSDT